MNQSKETKINEVSERSRAPDGFRKVEVLGEELYVPVDVTAPELAEKTFPERKPIVEGLLVPGIYLMAGKPKVGKSWAAMQIGMSVAAGIPVFGGAGFVTRKTGVRYFGLEDSFQRLKTRQEVLKDRLGLSELPAELRLSTHLAPFDGPTGNNGIYQIDYLVNRDKANGSPTDIVVIDMLKNVRPSKPAYESIYEYDSRAFEGLRELVDWLNMAFLLVHHTNKGEGTPEDFLASISGSRGLAGAVDGALLLDRPTNSSEGQGKLLVAGRDIEANDYDMVFEHGLWRRAGSSLFQDRDSIEFKAAVLLAKAGQPKNVTEIAEELGANPSSVRSALSRGAKVGRFVSPRRGLYSLPPASEDEISA